MPEGARFTALLRQRRVERGLSLEAAGAQLNVGHTVFRSWERGEARPTARYIGHLAIWLGVPISTVLRAMDVIDDDQEIQLARLERKNGKTLGAKRR